MQDLRRFPRRPYHLAITVEGPGNVRVEGFCRDLSVGGMFLETAQTFAFGTAVTIELPLLNLGTTRVPAVVRWVNREGMGVAFGLIGARETNALTTMLSRQSPHGT